MTERMSVCFLLCVSMLLLAETLVNAHKVQNFPPSTFQSDWMKLASNPQEDFHNVSHGLGQVPLFVKVLVRATDGNNRGYIFEAVGIGQTDDDLNRDRGGVIYAYTEAVVYIWVAVFTTQYRRSHSILVDGSWGSGMQSQKSKGAEFQVLAWSSDAFYVPDFTSDPHTLTVSEYAEIQHDIQHVPEMVQVVGSFENSGETIFFEATGSQQSKHPRPRWEDSAGLLFAYSEAAVRIWTGRILLFSSGDGYPIERGMGSVTATVVVKAWASFKGLRPTYESEWFDVDQSTTFHERSFTGCSSVRHVDVRVLATDGNNLGFIFPGVGMAQVSHAQFGDEVGGVVFAYTADTVRLWIMDNRISPNSGVVVVGLGDGTNRQRSSAGRVRIRVWCGNMTGMFRIKPDVRSSPCKHFQRIEADIAQSMLVKMGSVSATSFPQCLQSCDSNEVCTAVSLSSNECELYGDRQTGTGTEEDKAAPTFRATGIHCGPCNKDEDVP